MFSLSEQKLMTYHNIIDSTLATFINTILYIILTLSSQGKVLQQTMMEYFKPKNNTISVLLKTKFSCCIVLLCQFVSTTEFRLRSAKFTICK